MGVGVGVGAGVRLIGGTETVGVGSGVAEGVAVGLGVGDGVGVGQAETSPNPESLCEQSGRLPDTGVKGLGLGRLLTNGTAIAAPVLVPKTWFIPCSACWVLVCPVHVATTQSGVYVM